MIASPLQMFRYFVTDCQVTAAKHFKFTKQLALDSDLLVTEPEYRQLEDKRQWEITLRTRFQPGPKVNAPYFFVLEIVGFFQVVPQYPEEKLNDLVKVNGPSMLYGITREVIRDLTSRGPHPSMFLPSASFLSRADAPKPRETRQAPFEETGVAKASRKRAGKPVKSM